MPDLWDLQCRHALNSDLKRARLEMTLIRDGVMLAVESEIRARHAAAKAENKIITVEVERGELQELVKQAIHESSVPQLGAGDAPADA